ncbi:glycogen debranching protein GlgX [Roseospira navarrensis]|uniref:Glycogen debranching protein GlgX n=1 Tax=Roseospira navarrensis TaxID=140058 RepID=A0A7X1ZG99_9PROT|nr:glycogen debranching protein GlgX [Roseospira navarrensis]MQX37925.1 glycogen debranching protein GlgX [Roseospira navarrensis]
MGDSDLRVWPGHPWPLGATWDGRGVNFALFSERAERVQLCLFDDQGRETRVDLPEYTDEVWHGYLPDAAPGQVYGYRVYGPHAPERGLWFNPHKLLIDPYARALVGRLDWAGPHFCFQLGHPRADLSFCTRDNAATMLKCQVVEPGAGRGTFRPPRHAWHTTILYEMHVRGFTMRHPEVHESYRGTLAGLSAPAVIDYLRGLGITAVELLPVHAFLDDRHLVVKGLRNYWGYNPIGFFAPHPAYLATGQLREFRAFVRTMHDAGIEVILDVVYNHTGEGNHMGPMLSFRGIDNASYYRLVPGNERYYMDSSGCGNTLNFRHHRVVQLVMDSLRYWVEEMGVDGFRFDLASAMAREAGHFDREAGFLDAARQDPVLCRVKMIAEPWDVGDGGYQLGNFPAGWAEWNDRYRDTVRSFWRGDPGQVPDLATRITGSSDVFARRGRKPWASVNFVTAHDGFTLADLVSYDRKHNEANGEGNRDGTDDNRSWNHGVEGPTPDNAISQLRLRQRVNMLATLLLSQGVPMLLAGDEFGHSQQGNNNPYCQDNPITWLDWERIGTDGRRLTRLVSWLIRLRRDHIVWRRDRFLKGEPVPGTDIVDAQWINPDGRERQVSDWENGETRFIGLLLRGAAGFYYVTPTGEPRPDESFLLCMNSGVAPLTCRLPVLPDTGHWLPLLDSADGPVLSAAPVQGDGTPYRMAGRSLVLFRRTLPRAGDGGDARPRPTDPARERR